MRPKPEDTVAVPARQQVECLQRLGEELTGRGLLVRLTTPPGYPPALHVINPESLGLTEDITVEFAADGGWFQWSWQERIARVEDLVGTADKIVIVLNV